MLDVRESLTQQDKSALHVFSYTDIRPQWRAISPIYFRSGSRYDLIEGGAVKPNG
jgi:hypothetical protein